MTKGVIIAGALGGGALLFYLWHQKSAGPQTPLGIPAPNLPGSMPRVDNQAQPWYNNAKTAVNAKVAGYVQNPAVLVSDTTSVVHSMSDIWGSISGLFDGGETAANVDDNVFYSDDPTAGGAYTDDMAAAYADQSDMLSQELTDSDTEMNDVAIADTSPGFDWSFAEGSSDDWASGYSEVG